MSSVNETEFVDKIFLLNKIRKQPDGMKRVKNNWVIIFLERNLDAKLESVDKYLDLMLKSAPEKHERIYEKYLLEMENGRPRPRICFGGMYSPKIESYIFVQYKNIDNFLQKNGGGTYIRVSLNKNCKCCYIGGSDVIICSYCERKHAEKELKRK